MRPNSTNLKKYFSSFSPLFPRAKYIFPSVEKTSCCRALKIVAVGDFSARLPEFSARRLENSAVLADFRSSAWGCLA